MAGEMLVLKSEGGRQYLLSQMERSYECVPVMVGSVSRAIDGTLNQRLLAYKSAHVVTWEALPYDDTEEGIGVGTLRRLVSLSGTSPFTLEVDHYPLDSEGPEVYTVKIDHESFRCQLLRWTGESRRYWTATITFLEV